MIEAVKASGLLGRGGAGFNCGLKWELARKSSGDEKYLIGNADEGEVGAFKDRYLLTHDPFSLIEGLAIASYAVGAAKAYIYLRAEYHFLFEPLTLAVKQAEELGYLKNLNLRIFEGAGAYICGEESALMDSIEGRRGEPRCKPPFPTERGLFGKPTVINNVATLANIPQIILKGPDWFRTMGTEKSRGTKVFSVSGDVERPGVYELPLGSLLKELVVDLAGAREIKAVQVGGASGRILPEPLLDTPLAFEHVLGSGAVLVFNRNRDMIEMNQRNVDFFNEESCGKCTPCREGTEVMKEIFGRLVRGEGQEEDLSALGGLASAMRQGSFCGLGQSAPLPILDSLKYFKQEYDQRLAQSRYLRTLKIVK
ncbi:MAG: SLBB domain-containing protein [Deltaproteobacteria bacterium]|nr:SLBB domain-containing protein [Deltaproteobacteria bacterium]